MCLVQTLPMAEGISKEVKIKAASKALTSQLFNLTGVIDPLMMALKLISENIIDQSILERIRLPSSTKNEKACDVLTAICSAVRINPDCFANFCNILDNEPVTKDISRILKEKYQDELHRAQQMSSCTCTVLQKSFLEKLMKLLDALKLYSFADQKKMEQTALSEYVTCFIQAGCSSTDHLDEHLLALHEKDNLITDVSIYHWAKQLAAERFSEIVAIPTSPITVAPVPKLSLFSKPVVYHASICSLAVNKTDAGEYQKFLKDKRFVPGHSFKEVSISRSKQDRYLIATQDNSTYYIAFQSEPNITEWPKRFASFENGITIQADNFPIDFITELLNNDTNRVVLTGFSFGGMLACSIAVRVWQRGYIPAQLLQENLVCITFAQPHLPVPQLADLVRDRPEIASTIHAIYFEEDIVPRLLRVLDLPCSTLIEEGVTKKSGLQMKVKELPKAAFQDLLTQKLLLKIGQLLFASVEANSSLSELVENLKKILEGFSRKSGLSQSLTYYMLSYSTDQSSCLQFSEMTKDQSAIQSSHLKTDELLHFTSEVFKTHSIEIYCEKLFRGYLDKTPEYIIQSQEKAPVSLNMTPTVSGVTIHEHGSEVALVVEGTDFWFCHRLSIRGKCIETPASQISGTSIKLNFDMETKPTLNALSDNEEISLKVFTHFMKSPVTVNVKVLKKEYPVSTRQRQLARLTPSQLIEVTYLSALLENHPYISGPQPQSHKVTVIKEFLDKVVNVVPLESVGYAIAYGNDHVALQCVNVVDDLFVELPSSHLMNDGFIKATGRVTSGMSVKIHNELARQVFGKPVSQSQYCDVKYTFNMEDRTMTITVNLFDKEEILTCTCSLDELEKEYVITPYIDLSQLSIVKSINSLQRKVSYKFRRSGTGSSVICGLNISSLYGLSNKQLKSPIETLQLGKEKLASLFEITSNNLASSVSSFAMCLDNSLMLETVNDIRQKELAICTSLLAGFMEQHEIVIPLMKSEKDHSKVLELSARASVGVWALSSLDFEHIQPILKLCRGEQLLVKIEDYIKGIVEAKAMSPTPDDTQYAAKLQFIVQGAKKTVTCNSQYISYSLERQLADLCSERKITEAIALEKLVSLWEQLFEKNILSLVAKSHRPLIARWLKWALMVHNLREELAKYTAVGVVGLVNSGKSRLITTLFGIQIPSGTTEENRTTVPFMYNLEDKVDGLDVVDFPGVDDRNESISGLADLLLTLAQIIIFVVDYRKVHTESSKKWLDRLQVEKVPVLVCLTFADKLYAEHMKDGEHLTDESKYPDKRSTQQKLQAELARIKEKLKLPPSHQIEFCSFSQDKDSILNCKEGRQRLRDVGISTPSEVGDWLVDTFRKRFGQDDLADRLRDFVHGI